MNKLRIPAVAVMLMLTAMGWFVIHQGDKNKYLYENRGLILTLIIIILFLIGIIFMPRRPEK